jgi:dienelactone hydrolase
MKLPIAHMALLPLFLLLASSLPGQSQFPFKSAPLREKGDLSALMVEDIDRFLMAETERVRRSRNERWQRDFSDPEAFRRSIAPQRELLARCLGTVDRRVKPEMEVLTGERLQQVVIETEKCHIRAVRWKVLEGLDAEGLLLQPKGKVLARAVVIPDADMLPEFIAGLRNPSEAGAGVARRLADAGWEILVPVLVNRSDTFSGSPLLGRFTNQPHREWIYRQGFELGRHIIGYELQKIFGAIDWLESRNKAEGKELPLGVAGYGEGGMLALQAAALDERIASTLVSGYFDARERLWQEPIYRNVSGLLKHFGDAELAVMAWPRRLVVEYAEAPDVKGPPAPAEGRSGAAPGRIHTPERLSARAEWDRAQKLLPANRSHLLWVQGVNDAPCKPFSEKALGDFAGGLHLDLPPQPSAPLSGSLPSGWPNAARRQERTVRQMEQTVQELIPACERTRNHDFWQTLTGDTAAQQAIKRSHRERFWEVIGRLPAPSLPANVKARLVQETEKWTGYELTLDVWDGVFAWGILLIPKDLKPGERRPAVVCQHGLEGVPADVVTTDPNAKKFPAYQGYASRLADLGYVTFAPHNPYRGEDKFRVLQRKANPLGLSLFSVIVGQHQRIVEWLGQQAFVDPARIGFYGLSYGGKSAMRIPALVEGYALSICSGDFNEWIRKNVSTAYPFSYMFTKEYEMPEWDLGHTFSYAEMAALIAPRPFMVEFGHYDGIATDEWVNYEFGKVRRHYDLLGLPERARIEHFNGPHRINGVGTFEFLERYLKQ